jgi:hypothetical protein
MKNKEEKGALVQVLVAQECNADVVKRGVHMYMWQLAPKRGNKRRHAGGCDFISHTFWLRYKCKLLHPN